MKRILMLCVAICALVFIARAVNKPPCTSSSITSQPPSQAVAEGSNAVFTVTASGSAPLYYQWSINNTNLTNGGNISEYTAINDRRCYQANRGRFERGRNQRLEHRHPLVNIPVSPFRRVHSVDILHANFRHIITGLRLRSFYTSTSLSPAYQNTVNIFF